MIRKLTLVSKFPISQTRKQIITMYKLELSEEVKTIREWNMKNIFLEKSYKKLVPDPFLKLKIEHITGTTV